MWWGRSARQADGERDQHDEQSEHRAVAYGEQVEIYVGPSARPGEPTRMEHRRRHASGVLQTLLRPYARWWMSKERVTRVRRLRITVPVGVFPPRLFFSTRLVCRTIDRMDVVGKSFLEVGCGAGSISLVAARGGAQATALDISDLACETTRYNAAANFLTVKVVESDLFASVDGRFDVIVITPPYFQHDPSTQLDHAFHAGAHFEYFQRLFAGLGAHLGPDSVCLLTLAEGCDVEIGRIAAAVGYEFRLRRRWMDLLQWTYVFDVVRTIAPSPQRPDAQR